MGYRPWGGKESDLTEVTSMHTNTPALVLGANSVTLLNLSFLFGKMGVR